MFAKWVRGANGPTLFASILIASSVSCALAEDAPTLGFRVIADGVILSKDESYKLFASSSDGSLMDRVAWIPGRVQPKFVLRTMLVEGANVSQIELLFNHNDQLKNRLGTASSSVTNKVLPSGYTPDHQYKFAGTLFAPNQVGILLDAFGDTDTFSGNMDIANSPAFWKSFSLIPLAVAVCNTTTVDAAYGMDLNAKVDYDTGKIAVARIAKILWQCTSTLTSPIVHRTRIEVKYENGEVGEFVKCNDLACGEWHINN